ATLAASTPAAATRTAFLSFGPDPSAPVLSSMPPTVSGVTGGATVQVSVTLTGPAPAGGAVVNLTNSNPNAATVPASVTVPAGQGVAAFNVVTKQVAANTSVTVTGTYGGGSVCTTIAVNAPAGGGPPAPASCGGHRARRAPA